MATNKIEIRKRIMELLLGKTKCGQNVFTSRPTPIWTPELPAICISTPREQFTKISHSSVKIFERKPDVSIIILAAADENLENALDAIQSQVEEILSNYEYLPDPTILAQDLKVNTDVLISGLEPVTTEVEIFTEAKFPIGASTLRLACSYDKEWPKVKTPEELEEFNYAKTGFDINKDDNVEIDNTVNMRS
jgi:hypothetical protein